jgi:hypothetical protein
MISINASPSSALSAATDPAAMPAGSGLGFARVGRLAGARAPAGEVAESFHQGMDLGGQTATRATNRLSSLFFGAPAAC